LAFLARFCALIPPPRHPLIRFHGVVAPHSPLRKKAVPQTERELACRDAKAVASNPTPPPTKPSNEPNWNAARLDWATLLRRVHDIDALACACGGRLRFVQLVTSPEEVQAFPRPARLSCSTRAARQATR